MTSRTGNARRIWGDFEKVSELRWDLSRGKTVGFRLLAEARPVAFVAGATRVGEDRWKSQNRKIVPLSPYVEKPLNSKVIKSFVPEQRSRKCFSNFEIPMFYLYETLYVYFTHSRIWLWYRYPTVTMTDVDFTDDIAYTRILWAVFNKSWKQSPYITATVLPFFLITQTIQLRRTKHAGFCWSKDELKSNVLWMTTTHWHTSVGQPAKTYIQ